VIQRAIDTLEFSAMQKSIKVDYKFEKENVGYLMEISGDDNRYLQILLNFLSNAIKFTNSSGKIIIETRIIDSQAISQ
jgi:signal transduction histidine kinase